MTTETTTTKIIEANEIMKLASSPLSFFISGSCGGL
ncbi:hypothetical protein AAUPMC_20531 [Pasteurella multocida subsp. multocida str. Anand1_cattle]|nr:hypothetical protein AAUPMC_20531 [Pasteurella multocida subsp. multocida str. Anand1_cattle]